jgi:glycosyltransferase involved in cell wall biosynthesis
MDQKNNLNGEKEPSQYLKHKKVIAIVPAYNESSNIVNLVKEVKKYVTTVIVVDDGSNDDTFEKASSTNVKVLRNLKNRGKGASLRKGILEGIKYKPDIIVTLDADGQHDPADIPKIIKPIKDELADMVIGSRYNTNSAKEVPLVRGIGLSVINTLNKTLVNINVKDTQSGFRAYSKTVFGTIYDYDGVGYGAETEQLSQVEIYGYTIVEVPITIRYRGLKNTSKQNPILHGANIMSTIFKIAVEKRPLLFFGLGGLSLLLISLIPLMNLLLIFNETRYFSIPLSLIVLGLDFIGTLLIVISFILYALKRIKQKLNSMQ